jgi:hypothetical protein
MLNIVSGLFSEGAPPVAPTSYESIATAVGTGSAGTITFSSIPSTYKHLQIRALVKDTYTASDGAQDAWIQFNGDTASNYSYHRIRGNGTAASSSGVGTNTVMGENICLTYGTTTNYGVSVVDILDYANTSKYKTVRSLNGGDLNGSGFIKLASGCWRSTSAITSITFGGYITAFTTGTQFALYGIKG